MRGKHWLGLWDVFYDIFMFMFIHNDSMHHLLHPFIAYSPHFMFPSLREETTKTELWERALVVKIIFS